MQDTKLHSVPETAERLGVSPATVWRCIKDGRIRAVRIGSRVLVCDAELARLAKEGTENGREHQ